LYTVLDKPIGELYDLIKKRAVISNSPLMLIIQINNKNIID